MQRWALAFNGTRRERECQGLRSIIIYVCNAVLQLDNDRYLEARDEMRTYCDFRNVFRFYMPLLLV